jgi:hypothetical protein
VQRDGTLSVSGVLSSSVEDGASIAYEIPPQSEEVPDLDRTLWLCQPLLLTLCLPPIRTISLGSLAHSLPCPV